MGFLEQLLENGWLLWIAAALVLGILELASLDLVFAMLAGGALAGAAADALGLGHVGQVLVAAAAAGLLLAAIRPLLLRRLRMPAAGTTNTPALLGRTALVLADVSARGGLVKLVGETWSARTTAGRTFAAGEDVVVVAIEGATAVVDAPPAPPALPAPQRPEEAP